MFDEYHNNQRVEIKPACTGLLQKSHPKSFFRYCHVQSPFREHNVDGNPQVLQVMIFGNEYMMVEMLPEGESDTISRCADSEECKLNQV